MKTLTFTVNIEFTGKVTSDEEIKEVANNVLRAIVGEANDGMGIAPELNEDALTSVITVTPQFLPEGEISKKVF